MYIVQVHAHDLINTYNNWGLIDVSGGEFGVSQLQVYYIYVCVYFKQS